MSENATSEMDFCDYCSRNIAEDELSIIYTVMNGIEQKERVCPDCEDEGRENEKPPARTDGGSETGGRFRCEDGHAPAVQDPNGEKGDLICPECGTQLWGSWEWD